MTTISNAITQIPGISITADGHAIATASSLTMTSFGIPLTVKVINSGKAQAMHYADMVILLGYG